MNKFHKILLLNCLRALTFLFLFHSWQADNWRSCSAECGPDGTQTRTVECRQKVGADVTNVVADDQCTGTKRDALQECNRKDCEPDWVPNDWSAVSYFLSINFFI